MATATVSPSALAVASVTAPTMPGRAAGSTTLRSTCHFVAPTLRAPSNWSRGHDGDGVPREGHDHRQDHDEQHAAGQEQPDALGGAWKGKWWPVRSASIGLHGRLEPGGEHEQAPKPVDHARHGREKLDQRGGEDPQSSRAGRGRWRGRSRSRSGSAKSRAMAVVNKVPAMIGSAPKVSVPWFHVVAVDELERPEWRQAGID